MPSTVAPSNSSGAEYESIDDASSPTYEPLDNHSAGDGVVYNTAPNTGEVIYNEAVSGCTLSLHS